MKYNFKIVGLIDVWTGWIINKNIKLHKFICKSVLIMKLFYIFTLEIPGIIKMFDNLIQCDTIRE
jgi:hypothetical protein